MRLQTLCAITGRSAGGRRSLALAAGISLLLPMNTVLAQTYMVETINGHTIRCSTVRSDTLPEAVLSRYLVAADPSTGVLSCVVQPSALARGDTENYEAELSAQAVALTGTSVALKFRQVLDNDQVTYLATYSIPVDGPLTFEVNAVLPEATEATLITFEDIRPQEPF